jgi:hypothetical protein
MGRTNPVVFSVNDSSHSLYLDGKLNLGGMLPCSACRFLFYQASCQ